ncbi:hypothetical protein [Marinisporobacter balticus]|uniref:Uncharacterized protein n=1 Tax=Marinisporobacter balticus TaxID=2018667 RepID=A0A4R2L0N3_9FIRM|nr:hypothetical protein [Marinisporobacter balticus]TCO79102.1 hypothetical protein EV214_103154 [Marinisporobacter balticus]
MNIRVHFPKTQEGQELLRERIAEVHVNMIKEHIEKQQIDQEEKIKIWEGVKSEIKRRAKEGGEK